MNEQNTKKLKSVTIISILFVVTLLYGFNYIQSTKENNDCNLYNLDFDNYLTFVGYDIIVDGNYLTSVTIQSNGTVRFLNLTAVLMSPISFLDNPKIYVKFIFVEQLVMKLRARSETSCQYLREDLIQIDYYELHDARFQYIIDLDYNVVKRHTIENTYDIHEGFEKIEFLNRIGWFNWNPENINFTVHD